MATKRLEATLIESASGPRGPRKWRQRARRKRNRHDRAQAKRALRMVRDVEDGTQLPYLQKTRHRSRHGCFHGFMYGSVLRKYLLRHCGESWDEVMSRLLQKIRDRRPEVLRMMRALLYGEVITQRDDTAHWFVSPAGIIDPAAHDSTFLFVDAAGFLQHGTRERAPKTGRRWRNRTRVDAPAHVRNRWKRIARGRTVVRLNGTLFWMSVRWEDERAYTPQHLQNTEVPPSHFAPYHTQKRLSHAQRVLFHQCGIAPLEGVDVFPEDASVFVI